VVSRQLLLLGLLGVLAAVGGASGCASDGSDKPVTYSLTARQNYERGVKEFDDENYQEAVKLFTFVKQKFPFSKYAVLAELRIADAQFERQRHVEAIDLYRTFLRSHPTHELVENGYVQYRIAEAYFEQVPDEWWLTPPAWEKDQGPTVEALRELEHFTERYPRSKYLKTHKEPNGKVLRGVEELRRHCERQLMQYELYVARYYLRAKKPQAVVWRCEAALKTYHDTGEEPQVMLTLGEGYLGLNNVDRAREVFTKVSADYPNTPQARRAQAHLERLGGRGRSG
jgi:outer membrane protein assembly factor BamD